MNLRRAAAALPALLLVVGSQSCSRPRGRHEEIKAHLAHMRATEKGMVSIDPAEGERLYNLVRQLNARRVLEIGTSNGYSGIWLAMGLEETGGKLITIEYDEYAYRQATNNFRRLRLDRVAELRFADALEEVPRIPGPFDLVFIDAWKADYLAYYEMVLPKVRSGGAIVAHDTSSFASDLAEFLRRITSNPALKTEFLSLGPNGMSVSIKQE